MLDTTVVTVSELVVVGNDICTTDAVLVVDTLNDGGELVIDGVVEGVVMLKGGTLVGGPPF